MADCWLPWFSIKVPECHLRQSNRSTTMQFTSSSMSTLQSKISWIKTSQNFSRNVYGNGLQICRATKAVKTNKLTNLNANSINRFLILIFKIYRQSKHVQFGLFFSCRCIFLIWGLQINHLTMIINLLTSSVHGLS